MQRARAWVGSPTLIHLLCSSTCKFMWISSVFLDDNSHISNRNWKIEKKFKRKIPLHTLWKTAIFYKSSFIRICCFLREEDWCKIIFCKNINSQLCIYNYLYFKSTKHEYNMFFYLYVDFIKFIKILSLQWPNRQHARWTTYPKNTRSVMRACAI